MGSASRVHDALFGRSQRNLLRLLHMIKSGPMADSANNSFVRWQEKTHRLFQFTINLFFGAAFAGLGFCLSMLKDPQFAPRCSSKFFFSMGLLAYGISTVAGLCCALSRLSAFRKTAQITRNAGTFQSEDKELEPKRALVVYLDRCTWVLFWIQVSSLGGGIIFSALSLALLYASKIF